MTFLLGPYAAWSCPVKIFDAFDPGTPRPEKPLDESLLEAFSGGSEFRESMLEALCCVDDVIDLRDEGHDPAKTLAVVETGAPVIVGGCLPVDVTGHRTGCPDALVRGDDRPSGRPGYWSLHVEPYRLLEKQHNAKELRASAISSPTTLEPLPGFRFRSYRQGVLLELARHWRLLQVCGRSATTPIAGVIGFDDYRKGMIVWVLLELRFLRTFSHTSANGYRLRSALGRYDHEHGFRVHVAQQAIVREPDDPRPPAVRPIRVPECEWCVWWETCCPRMDDDDISLRISRTPFDVRELQTLMGLGITTVLQLADADVEALLPDYLSLTAHRDRSEARLHAAARHAQMLKRGVALEKVSADPIGVLRALVEVDLDIETNDNGRTYLWGVLLIDRATGKQEYQHFSAFSYLSPSGEPDLAADFARWLVWLARKHPGLLVYHCSDYEVVYLRRMAQCSGHPDLLAACDLVREHFADLFQLVRDNFVAVDGLGLKVVAAKGAGFSWRDEEPGGLNSQTWFATAVDGLNAAERKAACRCVLEYNEDDVRATWHVREWMERLDSQSDGDAQVT